MAKIEITNVMKQSKRRVLFPLGIKLALIVALILMGSIWTITSLTTLMVSAELVRTAENTNFTINSRAAAGIEERLYKMRSDALLILNIVSAAGDNTASTSQLRNFFFERNPNIAAVIVPGAQSIINQQFLTNNELSRDVLDSWLAAETRAMEQAKQNTIRPIEHSEGLGLFISQTALPMWEPTLFEMGMETLEAILTNVSMYMLSCLPDEGAVRCLHQCLR